jgi:hypothetical protein
MKSLRVDQTLDVPAGVLKPKRLSRSYLLLAASGLLLVGLTVLITVLLVPTSAKVEAAEPVLPTVVVPQVTTPEPVEVLPEKVEPVVEKTEPEKLAFKVYLSPSREKDLVAGLKLKLFKREFSVVKDLDFGFLKSLTQHVKMEEKE